MATEIVVGVFCSSKFPFRSDSQLEITSIHSIFLDQVKATPEYVVPKSIPMMTVLSVGSCAAAIAAMANLHEAPLGDAKERKVRSVCSCRALGSLVEVLLTRWMKEPKSGKSEFE